MKDPHWGAVPSLAGFDLDETASDEKQKSFHHTSVPLFWSVISRFKEANNNRL